MTAITTFTGFRTISSTGNINPPEGASRHTLSAVVLGFSGGGPMALAGAR
jgi:hypothetical protein